MNPKSYLQSKKFWFNCLWLVVGVAGLFGFRDFNPDPSFQHLLQIAGAVVPVVAPIVNLILVKWFTKQPIE